MNSGSSRILKKITRQDLALSALVFVVSILFNTTGLYWSLPGSERSQFYPRDTERWYTAPKDSGRLYLTSPYEPYHPDESFLLDALSNMDPGHLDLNPHFFYYPTLSIYMTAGAIKAAETIGYVTVVNSKDFYVKNPGQAARIYFVGRLLAAVLSSFGVVFLFFTGKGLFTREIGFISAFILSLTPAWVRDSHFMQVNVPATTWMIACALMAAIALKRKSTMALVFSTFLAGLAVSTKYPAGAIILLPIFVGIKLGKTAWFAVLLFVFIGLGFLVGTPYALVAPAEFVQDVFIDSVAKLGVMNPSVLISLLFFSLGTILFLITMLGVILVLLRWKSIEAQFLIVWLFAGIIQSVISNADLIRYMIQVLPPFAICASIALDAFRRWITGPNRPGRLFVGWAASLVLLVPAFSYSVNIDIILAGKDIRNQVASRLAAQIEPGDAIGIVGNIYFDMPPIHAEKYQVVDINQIPPDALPSTIVLTSETKDFWNQKLPEDYTITTYSQRPLPIWTWPMKKNPHDWGYTFLDIYVCQKDGFPSK